MLNDTSSFRRLIALGVFLCALFAASQVQARSAGIASSALPAAGCNGCHSGGVVPTVSLVASAATIDVGATVTLTFTVTTLNGNPGAAGFNLRSSKQGTFAVGGPSSTNTRILTGTAGWSEATHTAPKAGEPATFTVLWTPSPGTTGDVMFTAWGNAVNANGTNSGDRAASDTETITVQATVCTTIFYRDVDGDGHGSAASGTVTACMAPSGYVAGNTDCNDGSPAIKPGAAEVCNGVDDDCTGGIDNGLPTSTFYRDSDNDMFGNPGVTRTACNLAQAGAGYVANNGDCNDANAAIKPNAAEICNGIDDNCTGGIDNGLPASAFYRDADGDTFGSSAMTKSACSLAVAGDGYVINGTDCDDADRNIYPGAPEICQNGKDDNCNGVVDTDAPANSTFYRDADGDGHGAAASGTAEGCAPPTGYVSRNDDCNDGNKAIHPSAIEVCNGLDDDCEGGSDEGFGTKSCGVGECARTVQECSQGMPQTCAPGAPVAEICGNGKDDNCNDDVDEGCMNGGADAGDGGSDSGADASADVVDAGSDASPPDGGPPTGSGAAGGAGGGVGAGGAGGSMTNDAGTRAPSGPSPPANTDDSGCGCRAAESDTRGWSLLLLGGLFALGLFGRRALRLSR